MTAPGGRDRRGESRQAQFLGDALDADCHAEPLQAEYALAQVARRASCRRLRRRAQVAEPISS